MQEKSAMYEEIKAILKNFPPRREYVLKAFHEILKLEERKYISHMTLDFMAEHFKLTRGELYGIISYYTMLSDVPRAPILVQVCTTTPCHFMGGQKLHDVLKKLHDQEIYVEETACLGHCELAPVIAVNGRIISIKEFQDVNDLVSHIKKVAYETR